MASVKTKVVNTETTNPAQFLAGEAQAPSAPTPPVPSPETPPPAAVPAQTPGSSVPVVSVAPAIPPTVAVETPNRPGLEPGASTPSELAVPDPFILLHSWGNERVKRTLRALPVPGGCLVRLSAAFGIGATLAESICFVPKAVIRDGKLVDDLDTD